MARYSKCDPLARYGVETGVTTDLPDDYEEIDFSKYRADGSEFEGKGWRTRSAGKSKTDATQYYKCFEGVNCSGCKDNMTTGYYVLDFESAMVAEPKVEKVRCLSCNCPIWHRKIAYKMSIKISHQFYMMNQGKLTEIGDGGKDTFEITLCSKCKKKLFDYLREVVRNSQCKITDEKNILFNVKTCGWCAGELIEYLEKMRRRHSNNNIRTPRLKKLGHWSINAKKRAKIRGRKRAKK